jgi:hypothetical protein
MVVILTLAVMVSLVVLILAVAVGAQAKKQILQAAQAVLES